METTRSYRYLFLLGDVLLLAAAGFLASRVILNIIAPPSAPLPAAQYQSGQTGPGGPALPGSDTDVILERNLFGTRTLDTPPVRQQISDEDLEMLPESTLPLELLGTVVQTGGKGSFAIILDTGTRQQQIYSVGDELGEGTELVSVARNRVVLLRNGQEEVLEVSQERTAEPASARSRERPTRTASLRTSSGTTEPITVRKVGDNSFVMDRREVEGVLQDFNKLLTQIRVVPHFADGKPDGFKIFNIRPGSLFAQLGMVNGDIIKRVNGLDITGPEQALQMFTQLRDESQVTVDLERFRKNLTLQYEIR